MEEKKDYIEFSKISYVQFLISNSLDFKVTIPLLVIIGYGAHFSYLLFHGVPVGEFYMYYNLESALISSIIVGGGIYLSYLLIDILLYIIYYYCKYKNKPQLLLRFYSQAMTYSIFITTIVVIIFGMGIPNKIHNVTIIDSQKNTYIDSTIIYKGGNGYLIEDNFGNRIFISESNITSIIFK